MPLDNPLDLYAVFEDLIPFEQEQHSLHNRYLDLIVELKAKSVLDVGCGSGKFLAKLKERAIRSKGIDLSETMIKKASDLGVEAEQLDLCDVTEKFDLITAIFDVINYLDESELERFFTCTNKALEMGGYYLFDSNTHFGFSEVAVGSLVLNKNDIHATVESRFENEKLYSDFTLFLPDPSGLFCKEKGEIVQYFHTKKAIKQLLKKAGFEVLGKFDIFLYGEAKSDKTLWVAQKQANL